MRLSILHFPNMKRPYLLKRDDGKYSQHAHFHTKEDAEKCKRLIHRRMYPRNKRYIYPMSRILTEEEFSNLNKKPKYINNMSWTRH